MGGSLCKAGMDLWFQNIPSPQEVRLFQLLRLSIHLPDLCSLG